MPNVGRANRWRVVVLAGPLALLAAASLGLTSCSVQVGTTEPSTGPTLIKPDSGWTVVGGAGFLPLPFKRPKSLSDYDPQLVGATGTEARIKWLADRAEVAGPKDTRSTLTVHVVSIADPTMRADVEFRGAGGAGFADLPIEAGKRTTYRLYFSATGTYRWCSVIIEVRK